MFHKFAAAILLGFLTLSTWPAQAQLYKWVDANGKTHYSSSPAEAGAAPVKEMQVDAQPAAKQDGEVPAWKKQEAAFKKRQAQREDAEREAKYAAQRANFYKSAPAPARGSNPNCNLAQDVLSGAVRHTNGAKTDTHDREVATRDVERFCK